MRPRKTHTAWGVRNYWVFFAKEFYKNAVAHMRLSEEVICCHVYVYVCIVYIHSATHSATHTATDTVTHPTTDMICCHIYVYT